eukprot:GHVU01120153.1.p1 GENE.GHVU01120153.1~~GHVU01120153.1.p1  ORF type:complete len:188 (+),score=11.38 GHVU01120153.1:1616-2179(+)
MCVHNTAVAPKKVKLIGKIQEFFLELPLAHPAAARPFDTLPAVIASLTSIYNTEEDETKLDDIANAFGFGDAIMNNYYYIVKDRGIELITPTTRWKTVDEVATILVLAPQGMKTSYRRLSGYSRDAANKPAVLHAGLVYICISSELLFRTFGYVCLQHVAHIHAGSGTFAFDMQSHSSLHRVDFLFR